MVAILVHHNLNIEIRGSKSPDQSQKTNSECGDSKSKIDHKNLCKWNAKVLVVSNDCKSFSSQDTDRVLNKSMDGGASADGWFVKEADCRRRLCSVRVLQIQQLYCVEVCNCDRRRYANMVKRHTVKTTETLNVRTRRRLSSFFLVDFVQ